MVAAREPLVFVHALADRPAEESCDAQFCPQVGLGSGVGGGVWGSVLCRDLGARVWCPAGSGWCGAGEEDCWWFGGIAMVGLRGVCWVCGCWGCWAVVWWCWAGLLWFVGWLPGVRGGVGRVWLAVHCR